MRIIDSTWYTPMAMNNEKYKCIGIVKILTEQGEEKYYIGVGEGINEQWDAKYIANFGTPFYPEIF